MADNNYGVYMSIRLPSGQLWSSSRETTVEVQADVVDTFGEEYWDDFIRAMLGEPAQSSSISAAVPTEAQAVAAVQEQLGGEPEGATPQFEKCDVCGGIKDQWKPPGVSKSGKSYPGFFGCSNFANHRR